MAAWARGSALTERKDAESSSDGTVAPSGSKVQPAWWPAVYGDTSKVLLAGGFAGAVSKSATAPLARLTILLQARLLQLQRT